MKWLALHIGGQKWGVYLVKGTSKLLCPHGDRLVGCCYYERCRIYLSRDLSESAFEDALIHELLHAMFEVSGAGTVVGSALKEESIVRDLTPMLHRLLVDLGFKFPKVNS